MRTAAKNQESSVSFTAPTQVTHPEILSTDSDYTVALVETLHVYSPHVSQSIVTGECLRDNVDKEASFLRR
jgi:hypothetical protein